tara:strand:- start:264 stop:440 length:177 start_codon:yes stop_codon:yes gene_type:complete
MLKIARLAVPGRQNLLPCDSVCGDDQQDFNGWGKKFLIFLRVFLGNAHGAESQVCIGF